MTDANGRSGGYRRPRRSSRGRRTPRRPRQMQPDPDRELTELEARPMEELRDLAAELEIDVNGAADLTKDALVNMVLQARSEKDGSMFLEGTLELTDEGYGFLRRDLARESGPDDVYVSQSQVQRFELRTGDLVSGHVRPARENDRYHGLVRVMAVNGLSPDKARARPHFGRLIPIFPNEQLVLEHSAGELTSRIVDIISPIGRGQRGLVLSPPRPAKPS